MTPLSTRLSTQLAVLAIVSGAMASQAHAQVSVTHPSAASPPPSTTTSPPATTTPPPSTNYSPPPASTPSPPPPAPSPPPSVNFTYSGSTPGGAHSSPTWTQSPDEGAAPPQSCAGGDLEPLPDARAWGGDVGGAVKAISRVTEHNIERCCATQDCIADALDNYAAALAAVAPALPLEMQNLPNIVATAAQRVRAARTRKQAVHALGVAIAAVHKTIVLLRAEDEFTLKAGTRAGNFVAETLQVAQLRLEKASGL